MWFTEDAWAPIIIFIMIGGALAFVAHSQQKPRLFVAAAFMGILAGMTYFIERAIVTEREKIEASIDDLARAFHENDRTGTLNYISPQNVEAQNLANRALNTVDIEDDYRITDMKIEISAENTLAQSHFRVNVTATAFGVTSPAKTRWKLLWRKEGGKWKITEVKRLDPITGAELPPLQITQ